MRVGLVYTRVRPTELPKRYFWCLAPGHSVKSCTGVDRRTCCWRCGVQGHQSKRCTATAQEAAKFKEALTGTSIGVLSSARQPGLEHPAGETLTNRSETAVEMNVSSLS